MEKDSIENMKLPKNWIIRYSEKSGKQYYYDLEKNVAQWEKPTVFKRNTKKRR